MAIHHKGKRDWESYLDGRKLPKAGDRIRIRTLAVSTNGGQLAGEIDKIYTAKAGVTRFKDFIGMQTEETKHAVFFRDWQRIPKYVGAPSR